MDIYDAEWFDLKKLNQHLGTVTGATFNIRVTYDRDLSGQGERRSRLMRGGNSLLPKGYAAVPRRIKNCGVFLNAVCPNALEPDSDQEEPTLDFGSLFVEKGYLRDRGMDDDAETAFYQILRLQWNTSLPIIRTGQTQQPVFLFILHSF